MQSKLEKYKNLIRGKKAVLYDFDGVLVDSEKYYYLSYNKAFQKLGHIISKKEYWKYWTHLGRGIHGEIKRNKLKLTNEDITFIERERINNYCKFISSGKIKFIEQSYRTVSLFKRMKMDVIIASNTHEKDLKSVFRSNGKKPGITLIGRKKGLRPKPFSDIFLYAAGYLKRNPEECFVIEDANKGLMAAKRVGMVCAIILNKHNRGLKFPKADIIFNSYKEFYELTKKII